MTTIASGLPSRIFPSVLALLLSVLYRFQGRKVMGSWAGPEVDDTVEHRRGKTGWHRALRGRTGGRHSLRGCLVPQAPALVAADNQRRDCPGVRGDLFQVPERSAEQAGLDAGCYPGAARLGAPGCRRRAR